MKIVKNLFLAFVPFICVVYSVQASQLPTADIQTPKAKKHEVHTDYSIFYLGESKRWKANLVLVSTNGKDEEHLELTYKGKDAKMVSKINYSILLPNQKLSGDATMYPNGVLDLRKSVKKGNIPPGDYVVKTTIGWNKEKETIHLHLNK